MPSFASYFLINYANSDLTNSLMSQAFKSGHLVNDRWPQKWENWDLDGGILKSLNGAIVLFS